MAKLKNKNCLIFLIIADYCILKIKQKKERMCFVDIFLLLSSSVLFIEFDYCISYSFFYFKKKTKNILYKIITNKLLQWILDSFLTFDLVVKEISTKKWKLLGYRLLIYILAFYYNNITMIFGISFLAGMLCFAIQHFIKHFIFSYQTKFKFQRLPLHIQQRFFELQSPLIRYYLPKIYFNKAMITTYKKFYIDNLMLSDQLPCCWGLYSQYPYLNHLSSYQYNKMLKNDVKYIKNLHYRGRFYRCKCSSKLIKDLIVIRSIRVVGMPIDFSKMPILNNLNLVELIISACYLNKQKLLLISQINLKSIGLDLLDDGTKYMEKMNDMLGASKGCAVIK